MAEQIELLRIYRDAFGAQLRASLAVQFQYRAAQVVWLLFFVLKPVIFLSIWSTVARSTDGLIDGYTADDFAAYFLATMWVIHLTFNGVLQFFESRIRQGAFSPLLLRPIHPISADVADNFAYKAITIPMIAVATAVLVAIFRPRLDPPSWALAAFIPSVFLAFVVRFINGWIVALSAFWLTRTQAIIQTYLFLLLFLGGEAAPLAILPSWVQTVAWWSPFRWQLAFPVELLLGRLSLTQALGGLGIQLLWAAISLALLDVSWRAAVRRYSAVGD
jgi:ABC-2 type transport system permease protein